MHMEEDYVIIPVLAVIADVLVIGFLLILKVGPPSWAYPTLFYVQVKFSEFQI